MQTREGLIELAKVRFKEQLMKINKALLSFAQQVTDEDLLLTHLPNKVKKPKWAKPIKIYGKASAWSLLGSEAAEREADRAEK